MKPHITEGTIGISLIKVRSCFFNVSDFLTAKRGNWNISNRPILLHILLQTSRDSVFEQYTAQSGATLTQFLFVVIFIQGIDEGPDGLKLISDIIREKLEIEVSVLMGANIASEVADEKFCETTIGQTTLKTCKRTMYQLFFHFSDIDHCQIQGPKTRRTAPSSKSCCRLPTSASTWCRRATRWSCVER